MGGERGQRAGVPGLAAGAVLLLVASVGLLPRLLYDDPQTAEAEAVYQTGLLSATPSRWAAAGGAC